MKKITLTDNQREYVKSSVITFLSAVAMALVADIDSVTLDTFKDGSVLGFLFVWVRAGIKGTAQYFITWKTKRK